MTIMQTRQAAPAANAEARDWLVAEVSPNQFIDHRAALSRGQWTGWFDMAVWLKTPAGATQRMRLELVYRDGSGEHRVPVDECPAGGHKMVLLNGSAPLTISGRVQWAGFFLKQLAPEVLVNLDLCHLAPRERRRAG